MLRIVSIIVLGLPLAVGAADVAPIENPDTHFYQQAAQGNLAEVDGGMLAQQRAASPAVKEFARMMVKDHTAANHMLRDLATADHVNLPDQPNADQRARRAALQGLSGEEFDKAYIEGQILMHKDAIALFKEESASGDDLAARNYATDTLPTLQSHLKALIAMPMPVAPTPLPQPAPNPAPSTPSPP